MSASVAGATFALLASVFGFTSTASAAGNGSPIVVGNVSTLGGAVPGLFAAAPIGVQAYFNYINSKGGVNGHKLVLKSVDDGGTCSQNESQTQSLESSVIAFVGSFTLEDNCAATVWDKSPTVPNIGYVISPSALAAPNVYTPSPAPPGQAIGPDILIAREYPKAVKHAGALYGSAPSQVEFWDGVKAALTSKKVGWKFVFQDTFAPAQTDFTSDVIRMRNAGVQIVNLSDTGSAQSVAQIVSAMQQQNYHPIINVNGTEYAQGFLNLVNPAALKTLVASQGFALYLGEDSSALPEVKLFQTWVKKDNATVTQTFATLWGWTSADLFVQALQKAGANPTSSSVTAALKTFTSFDAHGLLPPVNIPSKQPAACYLMVTVRNGKFARTSADPKSGFLCKPGGFYKLSGS
jgi:branched-chain amino acid transport system substrate-binding protein